MEYTTITVRRCARCGDFNQHRSDRGAALDEDVCVMCELDPQAGWTGEWPTEPGLYLFYGDYHDQRGAFAEFKPRLKLCEVWATGPDHSGRTLVASGHFLYDSEQTGIFRRFSFTPPTDDVLRAALREPGEG